MSAPCNERGEQLLLYVLEGLGAAEREAFAAHLAECEHCADAVQTARAVLDQEEPGDPRADAVSLERVRLRLQQRVRGAPGGVVPRPAARSALPRAALAAGIAIALTGAAGYGLHRREMMRMEERQRALTQERTAIAEEAALLAGQRDALEARLELARREADLLGAEKLVIVPLEPVDASPGAQARIFWDPPTLRCYLVARGLPPLGADRRYALWVFTASGETILVGSFSADGSGRGGLYAELPPAAAERIDRVVVTDELAPVGAAPTGAERLVWLRPV